MLNIRILDANILTFFNHERSAANEYTLTYFCISQTVNREIEIQQLYNVENKHLYTQKKKTQNIYTCVSKFQCVYDHSFFRDNFKSNVLYLHIYIYILQLQSTFGLIHQDPEKSSLCAIKIMMRHRFI